MMQRERERKQRPPRRRQARGSSAEDESDDVVEEPQRRNENGDRSRQQEKIYTIIFDVSLPGLDAISPSLTKIRTRKGATAVKHPNAGVIDHLAALHQSLYQRRVFADVSDILIESRECVAPDKKVDECDVARP